jgi:hypothetical protein
LKHSLQRTEFLQSFFKWPGPKHLKQVTSFMGWVGQGTSQILKQVHDSNIFRLKYPEIPPPLRLAVSPE